jgi:hypothetical protein
MEHKCICLMNSLLMKEQTSRRPWCFHLMVYSACQMSTNLVVQRGGELYHWWQVQQGHLGGRPRPRAVGRGGGGRRGITSRQDPCCRHCRSRHFISTRHSILRPPKRAKDFSTSSSLSLSKSWPPPLPPPFFSMGKKNWSQDSDRRHCFARMGCPASPLEETTLRARRVSMVEPSSQETDTCGSRVWFVLHGLFEKGSL